MRALFRTIVVAAIVMLTSACAGTPVSMGTSSSRTPPVAGTERLITAEACGFQLLLLIPVNVNDRLERAYIELQEKAAGDYIADVRMQERWVWAFIGTRYCTRLQAKAIRT
ncbi:MAG: hypothetical protein PHP86_05660 [Nevskiales bacterium]|nr:hypothetical protein [Nevskiales bacterium]